MKEHYRNRDFWDFLNTPAETEGTVGTYGKTK